MTTEREVQRKGRQSIALLIITKISIADYTVLICIGLRLYCTKEKDLGENEENGIAKVVCPEM